MLGLLGLEERECKDGEGAADVMGGGTDRREGEVHPYGEEVSSQGE